MRSATPGGGTTNCIDFGALPKNIEGSKKATVQGVTIEPLFGELIRLADVVDTEPKPKKGSDNGAELTVNRGGVQLHLPKGCNDLEVHGMQFTNEPISVIGFDANGKELAKAEGGRKQGTPHVLHLKSEAPITSIIVKGGGGEGVIYRICCNSGSFTTPQNRCIDFKCSCARSRGGQIGT